MKCEHCGATPNPGDQICMNCGAKLSIENAIVPSVEMFHVTEKEKKRGPSKILYVISCIVVLIVVIIITVLITLALVR